MPSITHIALILAFSAVANSRVDFPYAQVIQQGDLYQGFNLESRERDRRASFNCSDDCTAYVDLSSSPNISFAQNHEIIDNLTYVIADDSSIAGYQLKKGDNYDVVVDQSFNPSGLVVYVVTKNAPNYGAPVFSAQDGVTVNKQNRFATFLSYSAAVEFSKISGTFTYGYPKIYATGFDAISDVYGVDKCKPVYQSRSYSSNDLSTPTIFAPIITVDFGVEGVHSIFANTTDGNTIAKADMTSVVLMSPGYVGCAFEGRKLYYSPAGDQVVEFFQVMSDSLDITADYYNITGLEEVWFFVNQNNLTFSNANYTKTSFPQHFSNGAFQIDLSWSRKSYTYSSWALQLDFGNSGSAFSLLFAFLVVLLNI
ncbi:hypothetical protein PMAYCL1PPCAC_10510 [Pristionchus mayeri]|uniref:CUB domain-containing protein n=1 Tax=Pristionchus mayeri TaxID=1317129 RepID=A0AAN4ZMI3_9BILA|nr:hypothetical protein PMAYCL1PPCAC_10510 [Pristionchus mayeri]